MAVLLVAGCQEDPYDRLVRCKQLVEIANECVTSEGQEAWPSCESRKWTTWDDDQTFDLRVCNEFIADFGQR